MSPPEMPPFRVLRPGGGVGVRDVPRRGHGPAHLRGAARPGRDQGRHVDQLRRICSCAFR